jgi:hypothetical protein
VAPARREQPRQIQHTPVSDGDAGDTTTASGPWGAAGNPAAVLTQNPDGFRIFFGGLTGTNASADGVQSASTTPAATAWTQSGRVSSTTSAVPEGVGAGM